MSPGRLLTFPAIRRSHCCHLAPIHWQLPHPMRQEYIVKSSLKGCSNFTTSLLSAQRQVRGVASSARLCCRQ